MRSTISISAAVFLLASCATSDGSTATVPDTPAKTSLNKGQHAHVDDVFMHYDFNGDGIITAYEQNEYLKSDFSKADANGDGVTDGSERLSRSAFFAKGKLGGDANGDGKITRLEYETYVRSQN